jgi:hypothetical protein
LGKAFTATAGAEWTAAPWKTALLKGAGVGLADWAVDSFLSSATGKPNLFRPNLAETVLVTGAAMSPIPMPYKLAAIGAGWGIGRIYDILT